MFPIKFTFQGEVRRVQVYGERQSLPFALLAQAAKNVFSQITEGTVLIFQWRDDENDLISCSTDEELSEAMRVMISESRATFKFEVKTKGATPAAASAQPQRPSNSSRHNGITCDGCGVSPIIGVRFKCCVRNDFDLCETCEASAPQPHPMIKIYRPDQAPAAIFVAVNEQHGQPDCRRRQHCGGGGPSGAPFTNSPPFVHGGFRGRGGCPFRPDAQPTQEGGCGKPWRNNKWGGEGRGCGRKWGRGFVHPFAAAAEAFVNAFEVPSSSESEATSTPAPQEPNQEPGMSAEEQQLIDAVLRESLEDFETPSVDVPATTTTTTANDMECSYVQVPLPQETPAPAPASEPSPSAVQVSTSGTIVEDIEEEPNPNAAAIAVWARVWARELDLLHSMGFTDDADLIPLLQQFLGVPSSLSADPNGDIPVEKLQRLLAHLLGRSV